jgi:hypothetical protein
MLILFGGGYEIGGAVGVDKNIAVSAFYTQWSSTPF